MTKLTKILSTGAVAGLVLTGQVAQLTTVFAEDYTENIQQTWEKGSDVFRHSMLNVELTDADKQTITTLKEQREVIAEELSRAKDELDKAKEKYNLVEDKTELQSMLDEAQAKFDKVKEYFDVSTTVCKNLEFVEKALAENPAPVLPDLTNNETLSNNLDGIMANMYAHYNAVDASTPLDLEDVKNYVHDKAFLKAMEQAKKEMVAKLETMQQEYDNATDKTALETPLAEQKARVKTVSDFINSAIATLKDYLASITNESYVVRHDVSLEEVLKKKEEPKKEEEKPVGEETPKQEEKKEEEKKQEDKKEEKKEVKPSKKENIPTGVESYFLTYVGLALVSGAGVYKLTKE